MLVCDAAVLQALVGDGALHVKTFSLLGAAEAWQKAAGNIPPKMSVGPHGDGRKNAMGRDSRVEPGPHGRPAEQISPHNTNNGSSNQRSTQPANYSYSGQAEYFHPSGQGATHQHSGHNGTRSHSGHSAYHQDPHRPHQYSNQGTTHLHSHGASSYQASGRESTQSGHPHQHTGPYSNMRSHWYGLELNGARMLCQTEQGMASKVREGWVVGHLFDTHTTGLAWQDSAQARGANFQHHPPLVASDGVQEIHRAYERYQGEDPSAGDKDRIYGVLHEDPTQINPMLCPPGLSPSDQMGFIERGLDVTSLPGMYIVADG